MKKLSAEVLEKRIQKTRPWISLDYSTFKNVRTLALFTDSEYGQWWALPQVLLYQESNHPNRGKLNKVKNRTKYPQDADEVEKLVQANRPWISLKKETFISFCKTCTWVDSQYGGFKASPHQVLVRKSQHPSRSKAHEVERVEKEIQKQKPYLSIDKSTYKNKKTKTKLIDFVYGEWWGYPSNLIKGVGDHPERLLFNKTISIEEIKEKIQNGIILVEESYKGVTIKCTFIDPEYGEFEALPYRVLEGTAKHPDRNIGWTDEKIDKLIVEKNLPIKRISSYQKAAELMLFEDFEFGQFYSRIGDIKRGVSHPKRGLLKVIKHKEKVIQYLSENTPFIKLIEYKGFTIPSLFFDEKYGEYENIPKRLLGGGGLHPRRIETDIENIFSKLLGLERYNKTPVEILNRKDFKNYRPDFKLSDKIYVNCDGLYWHSEVNKDPSYHKVLGDTFKEVGLRLFQFYSDELKSKPEIVRSICKNSLGKTNTIIGARKTKFIKPDDTFFEENHLMGTYKASRKLGLSFDSEVVAGIAYKIKNRELFIERFCTKIDTSVTGSFSKILNKVLEEHAGSIDRVVNFIDLRYGRGDYLFKLGFELVKIHVGFKWTDGTSTFHRLRCTANMDERKLTERQHAEELGWHRIYDAGQAKFVLNLK